MPFNAEWQAKFDAVKKQHDDAVAADPDHPPAPPYPPCSAPPFLLGSISPTLSQWRITPEEVTFIDTIGFVRHVYTDGRAHPPAEELWATKMGDSVGHWDGDTLVVDTVGFEPGTLAGSLPHSNKLHVVERFTLNPTTLELTRGIVADDPVYFADKYVDSDSVLPADAPFRVEACKELAPEYQRTGTKGGN
jgi:hypothetical protein